METKCMRARWEEILDRCLTDLRDKYKNLSEAQIASKIGMNRATLNRVYNEKRRPHLANLVKILIGSGNDVLVKEALDSYDADVANVFDIALASEDNKIVSHEFEKLINDRTVFVAYVLSSLDSGTDKAQLINVLGSAGMDAISLLVQREWVSEFNGRYYKSSKHNMVRSFDSIKRHLNTYVDFYKIGHIEKKRNYVHTMTEGLNLNGMMAARSAHKRFHEEMAKIMDDKRNHGEIPFFSVALCDSFTSIESETTKKEYAL
ncbi:MAG: hypothetical protein A2504_16855 [Bdellovibrionales bacterium RIFOXYD12_FULL_39_22]|nr:MAG: hypothetical protein A2385_12790 [Bdellovibrionales bacterium RIFOXYB1_FULL_39_21]OFZ42472.1 MAG: hypothetical protein A2485_04125 [Bdellovibrionales bacterium RIFOXYC12_FULL_39_17]OFZ45778.1 MAG: hypothetical protein A2404_17550 [Bdellovibrionales bacterium RIFOXYC1_FULL_39_130]OFZ74675.1 MAG: hypothetical protein A2560_08360 [Bdellovibrionales bacterium RIFOXYD1_FULL_39_84]OFZ94361.1 MAG: hypothetical protein A2504_16855 [Bdellovibrionales bacterium RIFOXYD12_FULL_39_22]HLE11349.1 he